MTAQNIGFLVVVFLTNIIQCVTGFAGTVLAMPFSVMLIGLASAKAILNVLGAAASVGVLCRSYRSVNKKEFLKMTGFLLPGIVAGYFLSPYLMHMPQNNPTLRRYIFCVCRYAS